MTIGNKLFGYAYDQIGNRQLASKNADIQTYTANNLNQYSQINNGSVLTPKFDADGNLTNDGYLAYTWDAENRLTSASGGSVSAVYKYDYMSRRYQKVSGTVTNTFTYDGWNLVREVSSSGITNVYNWGLDLSGSLQGAGGIGGLLSVTRNGNTYYPVCDGNGNITDYVDASGSVVAHREFDAYGNTLVATGAMVNDFHHWFSSKYLDADTGLYYYGYRWYDAKTGRWLGRDPIAERGGKNLYSHCLDNSINRIDPLGLDAADLALIAARRALLAYEAAQANVNIIRNSINNRWGLTPLTPAELAAARQALTAAIATAAALQTAAYDAILAYGAAVASAGTAGGACLVAGSGAAGWGLGRVFTWIPNPFFPGGGSIDDGVAYFWGEFF